MKKEDIIKDKKYLFWAIALILIIISYLVIKPFVIALISAFILAYLIKPVYKTLNTKINKNISAAICIALIIIVLIVPAGLILGETVRQVNSYSKAGYISELIQRADSSPILQALKVEGLISDLSSLIIKFATSHVYSIPSMIVSVFITLFGVYYILIDWEKLVDGLKKFLPFKNKKEISNEISKITNILVYGTLFVAILEFFLSALGFYLLGIKFYLILAALVFFFAFIPALGPALIWIPTAIYFLINQSYVNLIGTIVLGVILSAVIDSTFKARLLGGKSKINPLVMLVGIFGGIAIFGVFGFVIGPLILSYTIRILKDIITD